jgi:hypothetical protein
MRRYCRILMVTATLATAIAAVGCNHPLLPKTPPTTSAASLGTSQWAVLGEDKPVLGVDLYAPQNYSAATVQADGERTVAYIKNTLKADAIGIVWNFYSFNPYNASITANADTLSASNVAILTRIAQQHHLQVEYRPIIQVMNQPNNWSGLISPYPESNWFNNYFKAELPYLKVAQELKVPEFVAGTELYRLNNSSFWPFIVGWQLLRRQSRILVPDSQSRPPASEIFGYGHVLAHESPKHGHLLSGHRRVGKSLRQGARLRTAPDGNR